MLFDVRVRQQHYGDRAGVDRHGRCYLTTIQIKLRKIVIDHEDWIFSIGFTVEDLTSGSLISSQHGGTGGRSGGELTEVRIHFQPTNLEYC